MIPWRRERLPTPVFWSGEFHRLYSPWVCKELDTNERCSPSLSFNLLNITINSLAKPTLNVFRTLTLAYGWAKSYNTYFIIKCWISHAIHWMVYWKWKIVQLYGYRMFLNVLLCLPLWASGSLGTEVPSAAALEESTIWHNTSWEKIIVWIMASNECVLLLYHSSWKIVSWIILSLGLCVCVCVCVCVGFPSGSVVKNPANTGDEVLIPG